MSSLKRVIEQDCRHLLTTAQSNKSYCEETVPAIKPDSPFSILLPQNHPLQHSLKPLLYFYSPKHRGLRQILFKCSLTFIPAPSPSPLLYWFSQNVFSEIQVLPAVCSNRDVNISISGGSETTLALCNVKELHPKSKSKLQIYKTYYTGPPVT